MGEGGEEREIYVGEKRGRERGERERGERGGDRRGERERDKVTHLRQGLDEAVDIGSFGCLDHLSIWYLSEQGSVADVLCDGRIKQHRLLRDDPHLRPQPPEIQISQVVSVQRDAPCHGIVEPLNQRDGGALATPTWADEGQCLAGGHLHGQALEHVELRTGRVVEVDAVNLNGTGRVSLGTRGNLTIYQP